MKTLPLWQIWLAIFGLVALVAVMQQWDEQGNQRTSVTRRA
jgi:hypothetical protein